MKPHYITGQIETSVGQIEQVSTVWTNKDLFSTIKVRWSIGRMNYKVTPGLYAVGKPDENSDVYVSCNFNSFVGLHTSPKIMQGIMAKYAMHCSARRLAVEPK